jgi:hypothetical protein
MPLLLSTAQALSNDTLERGVIETIIDRDDMFAMLPFMKVDGKAYVYNRENTMSGADWLAPNATVNESASDVTSVTALLKILIGDVDVDKFLAATMGDTNNQVAIQIAAKAKAVARKFHQAVAAGDSSVTSAQFDGIQKLVDDDYTIEAGANGAAVTLAMLDQLKDAVILGPDALVMRRGTWRAIKQLIRASGGLQPQMVEMENFGHPVPAFDGVPVLMNDFLSATETQGSSGATTCSIYAVRFNEADGLHAIYGGDNAGMVVEDIGTVQNKDANRIRVKWYCGLALKSNRSLARLKGVTNT